MTTEDKKIKLKTEQKHDFDSLRELVEVLRSETGCPWDREQSHESIRNDLIEETYEVIEAIDNGDKSLLREELGDVMFQVIFHSRIEEEAGSFDINDVIGEIVDKMISRHPHVFGNVEVNGSGEVLDNWEKIKKEEKSRKTVKESMASVPKQLPALMRTKKIIKKAEKDGCALNFTADDIIKLAEKLKSAEEKDKESIIADIVFDSVAIAGQNADIEKKLSEKVDSFIENYRGN